MIYSIIFLVFLLASVASMIINIIDLFRRPLKVKSEGRKNVESIINIIFTLIGPVLFFILFCESLYEYNIPLMSYSFPAYHTPVAGEHALTFIVITYLAVASHWILRYSKGKLPPIIGCVLMTLVFMGIVLNIFLIAQLAKNIDFITLWQMLLYLINLTVLYINGIRKNTRLFIEKEINENKHYSNAILDFLYRKMINLRFGLSPFIFILIIPLIFIVQVTLILFGQKPDSIIKAMTQTCDWTFSQHTPPPVIEKNQVGHYLCTVAAKGHKRLVNPIRYGIRHGGIIKVNRQLLVANAFENLLEEYVPPIHRFIRRIYNRIGIPLYRYINNPWASDIIYIIMKPLELFFVFCLYCVDVNPENRINRQYIPHDGQMIK